MISRFIAFVVGASAYSRRPGIDSLGKFC